MALNLYGTYELNRIVDEIIKPMPQLFVDTFFPEIAVSESQTIFFDLTTNNKPRITPFVSPLVAGKLVEDKGFTTESFKTAYVKDKRAINPLKTLKRRAGEPFGGALSMQQREQAILLEQLQDQQDMFRRRLEVMAVEAILSGTQTVVGEGVNAVVNFQRDAGNTIVLTSTAKWDTSGKTNQADDLETWSQLLLEKCGSGRGTVIMDAKAWKLFRLTKDVDKLLDKSNKLSDVSNLDVAPRFRAEEASYKGHLGDFEIWVYAGKYTNDAGATVNMLPDNTVLLIGNVEGVQHYGAILDLRALIAQPTFVKSWEEEDPSVRYTLFQSAPLLVPYRKNAVIRVTVA